MPDDVWERFLTDSERDIRATAPREPSARARIVARRLREEDERAAVADAPRRRFGRRAAAPAAPPAWRSGTTEAAERRLARRRLIRASAGIVAVVLLLLVVLAPGRAWSLVNGNGWNEHRETRTPAPVLHAAPASPGPARLAAAS
ncbi:hypothetical protein [Actinacidiphila rubida]|uniref:hypothetical protein n=1 Tax=Actinacidiphila rubida TaxID=310780 RepID=UPI0009434E19|nr:hypothetical protein [Actinacidiphila rubida]